MIESLYVSNTPENFWLCKPNPSKEEWKEAVRLASPKLALNNAGTDIEVILVETLGEGHLGRKKWKLHPLKRSYYRFKPFIPAQIRSTLKHINRFAVKDCPLEWPIESRYVEFL